MTVKEGIDELKKCDMDADVSHLWGGALRTYIEHVYMGKTGSCVTAESDMVAYSDEARPIDAPSSKQDPYWHTPSKDDNEWQAGGAAEGNQRT